MQDPNDPDRLRWEKELVRRAQAGDRAAFAELYRTFAKPLYARVLLPRLGQRTAAEDALSETFRVALERLPSFESRGTSVYFWLARIAVNKASDMHRARGVSGRALVNVKNLLVPILEAPVAPEEALDMHQELHRAKERVVACLAAVNPRYRRALELRFFEGLGREECARQLDVKLGTFDVLLLRALRAFRKRWDEMTEENDG